MLSYLDMPIHKDFLHIDYPVKLRMYFLPSLKDWRLYSCDRLLDESEYSKKTEKRIVALCFCFTSRTHKILKLRVATDRRNADGLVPSYPNRKVKRLSSFKFLKLIRITEWRIDMGEPVMMKIHTGIP